jgi:hypothetical protein
MKFVNEIEICESCITDIVERMKVKNEDFEDAFEWVMSEATETQKEYDCVLGVKDQIEKEVKRRLEGANKVIYFYVNTFQRFSAKIPITLSGEAEIEDYINHLLENNLCEPVSGLNQVINLDNRQY